MIALKWGLLVTLGFVDGAGLWFLKDRDVFDGITIVVIVGLFIFNVWGVLLHRMLSENLS